MKQHEARDEHGSAGQHNPAMQSGAEAASTQNEGKNSRSARKMMMDTASTTGSMASGLVGGVTSVATDLVHGVGDVGGEVVSVVRDTANTAITGVGSVGETAVHTLTGLLVGLVGGVREIGSAAMRGSQDRMESRSTEASRPGAAREEERPKQSEEMVH